MSNITIDEALDTIIWLLSDSCNDVDKSAICRLLKLACIRTDGKLPIALLVFYVASDYLNKLAINAGIEGDISLDLLEVNNVSKSNALRLLAKQYKDMADDYKKQFFSKPIAIVNMTNYCITSLQTLYDSCKCQSDISKMATPISCNFDCCNEC